jgi:hypothetical protein
MIGESDTFDFKKTLIIQTCPEHTGSTFLVNALYGLINELKDKKIIYNFIPNYEIHFKNIILIKSHNIDIDGLIKKYNEKYNLFFICSERKDKNLFIDDKYKSYDNVVVFDFNELNETETNTIPKIIENIYNKLKNVLPIELNIENSINRIILMNKRYEEIKHQPFRYIDKFYELHGSHRNRPN